MTPTQGGSYIVLTTRHGADYLIQMGCLEQLESAYAMYNEQPPHPGMSWTPDKVLELPLLTGTTLRIAAGQIAYFHDSTVDARESMWLHNRSIADHKRATVPEGDE